MRLLTVDPRLYIEISDESEASRSEPNQAAIFTARYLRLDPGKEIRPQAKKVSMGNELFRNLLSTRTQVVYAALRI